MRRLSHSLLALFALAAPLQAAEFPSGTEARRFADALVQQFLQARFAEAFDRARPYWPLPAAEIDGLIEQVRQQWPVVRRRFGRPMGTEFIREEAIGDSFLRYYYLHKFEHHAIYWRFDFYRPEGGWKINSILFLDTLDDLYR